MNRIRLWSIDWFDHAFSIYARRVFNFVSLFIGKSYICSFILYYALILCLLLIVSKVSSRGIIRRRRGLKINLNPRSGLCCFFSLLIRISLVLNYTMSIHPIFKLMGCGRTWTNFTILLWSLERLDLVGMHMSCSSWSVLLPCNSIVGSPVAVL